MMVISASIYPKPINSLEPENVRVEITSEKECDNDATQQEQKPQAN